MENRIESWRMAAKPVISLVLAAAVHVAPAATVGRVFARQMWPWQTHFEVSYVLETAQSEAVDVSLKVSSGDTEFSIPASELLGETKGLTSGEYRLVWDSAASSAPTAQWLLENSGKLQFTVVTEAAEQPAEYLVIDLSGGPGAESWPAKRIAGKPLNGWTDEYKTTKLVLRRIMAGGKGNAFSSKDGVTFKFGCAEADEPYMCSFDFKAVDVTLTNDYWIGIFELTQKQFQLITGSVVKQYNNAFADSDMHPQANISYYTYMRGEEVGAGWPQSSDVDDGSIMGILRRKVALPPEIPSAWKFDLPTEAQWEYACRAGTTGPWNNGGTYSTYIYKTVTDKEGNITAEYEGDRNLDLLGWNPANAKSGGSDVGLLLPNAWGLYDMHGNAAEYCLDYNYSGITTSGRKGIEPLGYKPSSPTTAKSARVLKGGAYSTYWTSASNEMKYWKGHRSCSHVQTYNGGVSSGHLGCRITLRNSAANAGH